MTRSKKKQKLRHDAGVSGYGTWMAAGIKKGLNELYYKTMTSGDWMGDTWSDGKRQESVVGYSTARSYGDQKSKEHDIGIALGKRSRDDLDQDFIDGMWGHGIHNSLAAVAVGAERMRRNFKGPIGLSGRPNSFTTPAKKSFRAPNLSNGKKGKGRLKITQSAAGQPSSSVAKDLFHRRNPATLDNTRAVGQMQNGGAEIPIMPVPKNISKIHPDHFTIRLPFTATLRVASTNDLTWNNNSALALIRLNSIYDPLKSSHTGYEFPIYSTFSDGTATTLTKVLDPNASTSYASINQNAHMTGDTRPQGRDIWAAHFKYYRVLRSDVKVTWINNFCCPLILGDNVTGTPSAAEILTATKNGDATLNTFLVGYELCDENALLSDTGEMFNMTKNAERMVLGRGTTNPYYPLVSTTTTANDIDDSGLYYNFTCAEPATAMTHFTYIPEAWQHHVENKGEETRWTAVGSNPTIDHHLALRCFHNYRGIPTNYTSNRSPVPKNAVSKWLTVIVQIEYEVQFIECLDSFYKVQQTTTSTEA